MDVDIQQQRYGSEGELLAESGTRERLLESTSLGAGRLPFRNLIGM